MKARIQLEGINLLIRGIFMVRLQTGLARFHRILQTAMGWTNSHLYLFEINGRRIAKYLVNFTYVVYKESVLIILL